MRTPTTIPEIPSRTRIGNSNRESETVRSRVAPSKPGAKTGMITGAARMKNAVIRPRTTATRKISVDASRNASRRRPCSSSSVNTGTNAAWIAASANRLRTVFGIRKAIVNADIDGPIPK